MEQFIEVVSHLQAAYIAGTGNPDIGPADGRMSRIGALIVEMGGVQAFHQAQREANIVREETAPAFQKKTQKERKPSATLLNASENPVLQNLTKSSAVAGNPDKGFSKTPPSNAAPVKNALAEMMESEESKELNKRISNALEGSEFRMDAMLGKAKSHDSEVLKEFATLSTAEAMELAHQAGLEDLEAMHRESIRILNPDEYEGKTPKYIADNYSQAQIEATLIALQIDFDPNMSPKQKAAHLVKSGKV